MQKHTKSSSIVMVSTVIVVVYTHNLALGVLVGVVLAATFFANKIARLMLVKVKASENDEILHYEVIGQVFFASADRFLHFFDLKNAHKKITIDLTHAHFWDITSVAALDKVVIKLRQLGAEVDVIGMNEATETIVDRFGVHDKPEEIEKLILG